MNFFFFLNYKVLLELEECKGIFLASLDAINGFIIGVLINARNSDLSAP